MAISFPSSPTNGQIYSPGSPAPNYVYNTATGVWRVNPVANVPSAAVLLTGLSTASAADVAASDTVLIGIGKLQGQEITFAPLASPTLTGTPTAPTASTGTNTTQIATTALVGATLTSQLATVAPVMNANATIGVSLLVAHQDHVHPRDTGRATDTGRNKLHNPMFTIAQRGDGPWTTTGVYTVDRWISWANGGTLSYTRVALTDADRTAIGDEEAVYGLQNVFAGGASAANFCRIQQVIENVRSTSNKTVTVSFWAKCASGTLKLGVMLDQYFGTGGSAEAPVSGTSVTISTTWARYSVTATFASAAGKTIGSGSGGAVTIWYSSGSNDNAFTGNIGVQSGTVTLWGVQCEFGSVMTPLEKPDPRLDWSDCQRFYQTGSGSGQFYAPTAASTNFFKIDLPVIMAYAPTTTYANTNVVLNGGGNYTQPSTVPSFTNIASVTMQITGTATGLVNFNFNYTASCDL